MTQADHDMIDSAMNRAAEALEAPLDETPAPKLDAVEEAVLHEKITRPREERARDNSGKFAKKAAAPKDEAPEEAAEEDEQISDQEADVEAVEAQEQPSGQDEAPIEPPAFWSAEEKAAVAKAPREIQKIIAHKEAQRIEWANRVANEAERGKAIEKRLYEDLGSPEEVQAHKAKLTLQGLKDGIDELHRYRAWDRVLTTNVKAGISDLMRKNGLTPQDFLEDAEDPSQFAEDPRIQEALDRAQAAEEKFNQYLEGQQTSAFTSEIDAFKQGKDSLGRERRAFAEMYAPQITQATEAIQRQYAATYGQEMPVIDALNHGYEFVLAEVSKLHGIKPTTQQPAKTREQIIADAKKAQAAASSVSGAPSTGQVVQRPRLKGKNFSERVDSAIEIAMERAGA